MGGVVCLDVNGRWSSWSSYGRCSVTCGSGVKYRTRSCSNPPPKNRGLKCLGASSQSTSCGTSPCEAVRNGGTYVIRSAANNMVLDLLKQDRHSIGYKVAVWPAHYQSNQQWRFEKRGPNTYVIRSRWNGQVLDVYKNQRVYGSCYRVGTWRAHYGSNQLWSVEKRGSRYVIRSRSTGRILDVFMG